MKKRWILILLISMFLIDVQALELPKVVAYKAMITNKDGAVCYNESKKAKDDITVPYKTLFNVEYDANNGLIYVKNDDYECFIKTDDLGAMDSEFNLNNKEIEKVQNVKALVLNSSGINLRKGPATSFRKIVTVPNNAIVDIKYKAGTYWYYVDYDGKLGWLTSMNQYVGYEDDKVLVNNKTTYIYDSKNRSMGNIPANTEISTYLKLTTFYDDDPLYYVVYNGIKGYVHEMYYKTNGDGKIRLLNDVDVLNEHGNPYKKLSKGMELSYSMRKGENSFYFSDNDLVLDLNPDDYEYITEAKIRVKETGYIGEGLFGEEKKEIVRDTKEEVEPNNEVIQEKEERSNFSMIEFIIGVLLGVLVGILIFVIVKMTNKKKDKFDKIFDSDNPKKEEKKEESTIKKEE